MSHDMKKSSSEKRAEREQVLHGQQCRYSRMERDGRCEVAEKQFRHKTVWEDRVNNEQIRNRVAERVFGQI